MNLPGVYKFWLDQWKDFQTCWVISDTHFNDEDLRKGHPTRISDDDLVCAINSKVGKRDILFILGDVGDVSYLRKLRGYKILIMGNHDAGAENYERQYIGKNLMMPFISVTKHSLKCGASILIVTILLAMNGMLPMRCFLIGMLLPIIMDVIWLSPGL